MPKKFKVKTAHELLSEKMESEHIELVNSYKNSICKDFNYKAVITFSNEVAVKRDILDVFSTSTPNIPLIVILGNKEKPLDYLYRQWMRKEDSFAQDMMNLFSEMIANRGGNRR